jgi:hypothetical protein
MPDSRIRAGDVIRWLTAFAVTVVGAVALIGNFVHAQGNDAVYTQTLVDRAIRFGGSYYDNEISPKGPLEMVAHDVAARVGGYDGHWFVLSLLIAIACAILGFAAARTARAASGGRAIAFAAASVVFIHFALGNAPYSGLLYSRNILETLLAVAWILVLADGPWSASPRIQLATAIGTGAALGLAVQTIIPSIIDASVIGVAALVLLGSRVADGARRRRLRITIVASAAVAFLSAPIWYLLRGDFRPFWAAWWTYARDQNTGVGLSLTKQFAKGWRVATQYYEHRPILFIVLALFLAYTVVAWSEFDRKTRVMHLVLFGWLAGGWIQLVTGERYSDHYFVVIAVPSALIAAALAGHASAAASARWPLVSRSEVAWPLVAIALAFFLSTGTMHRLEDSAAITSSFTSPKRAAQIRIDNESPTHRSIQGVLDLVSRDHDALLLYDDNQFLYNDYRRIPATRFAQRYLIIGSIYLGRTDPKFILAGTQGWFEHDMLQANPAAFLKTRDIDSPIVSDWVAQHFRPVFTGKDGTVYLRDDVADSVLHSAGPSDWNAPTTPASDQGWTVSNGSADFVEGSRALKDDRLMLAAPCTRVDGVASSAGGSPQMVFHLFDPTGKAPETGMSLNGGQASALDLNGNVLESVPLKTPPGPVPFSIVVGQRASVLVVNGQIVAAEMTPRKAQVWVESLAPDLRLSDLHVGPANTGSGCPGT